MSGGPTRDLLRGNCALHDLRGAEHRLERRRDSSRPRPPSERHVDCDNDVGAREQQIVWQRINGSAINQNVASIFDGTKQSWDRHRTRYGWL